jgi:Mg2+ and Co2+ transporter CorA
MELENSLRSMGIVSVSGATRLNTERLDSALMTIIERLHVLKRGFTELIEVANAALSFIQGQLAAKASNLAYEEAGRATKLTLAGSVFVPFTAIVAIFSMARDNQPGVHSFWVYIVIAIIVTVLTWLAFYWKSFIGLNSEFRRR